MFFRLSILSIFRLFLDHQLPYARDDVAFLQNFAERFCAEDVTQRGLSQKFGAELSIVDAEK